MTEFEFLQTLSDGVLYRTKEGVDGVLVMSLDGEVRAERVGFSSELFLEATRSGIYVRSCTSKAEIVSKYLCQSQSPYEYFAGG